MTKWEYRYELENGLESFETKLNTLGAEGWELVSATIEHHPMKLPMGEFAGHQPFDRCIAILKRPKSA